MRPNGKIDLFRSFEGYVENLVLSNKEHELTTDYVTDFRTLEDVLLNLSFLKSEIMMNETAMAYNRGTENQTDIVLNEANTFESVFFQIPNGQYGGTFDYSGQIFDGIACDDKHITTKLDEKDSYLRFNTPDLVDWSAENTIEFWFKFKEDSAYDESGMIFTMTD